MRLQPSDVAFHISPKGVQIPFISSHDAVRVGFVGPYALASSEDFANVNSIDILEAWRDFSSIHRTERIEVRLPPQAFYPLSFEANLSALQKLGFRVNTSDVHQAIALTTQPPSFNRNRRRDLLLCEAEGLVMERIELETAHEIITKNRSHKGFPLSLGVEDLRKLGSYLPQVVEFYGVKRGDATLSAAIVFDESPAIRYVFMWGNHPSLELSGQSMALLALGLHKDSRESGFQYLSLGTSSVMGQENAGLTSFKRSLGAFSEPRITMMRSAIEN